ncbi:BON domain-containing protein [Ideonella sp.]|jgi:osmotically-inducible protein OsmY|uniref:BON domain-containing protein n=1 Tax=Ideonella sp. TaxID=1929293 RepID=UPI0037C1777B
MFNHLLRSFAVLAAATALLLTVGCNKAPDASTVLQSAPERSDDEVTTSVKTALVTDPVLKAYDIAVVTSKGDVRLTGQVDAQSQIDAAMAMVRAVPGVHSIHDELTLKK